MKDPKITLKFRDCRNETYWVPKSGKDFELIAATNLTDYRIGKKLSAQKVEELIACGVTVNIV